MAVFSTEQQPGSILVAPRDLFYFCFFLRFLFNQRNHESFLWLSQENSMAGVSWRSQQFLHQGCCAGKQTSPATEPLASMCLMIILDWFCFWSTEKHGSVPHGIILSFCPPPIPPFHVNFMDLSANGFPPVHPSRMCHLQANRSQQLSFPVASPLGLPARHEWASAGKEGAAHHLVLFTLLTEVLLSSHVISVKILNAHHQTDDSVTISDFDYITSVHI